MKGIIGKGTRPESAALGKGGFRPGRRVVPPEEVWYDERNSPPDAGGEERTVPRAEKRRNTVKQRKVQESTGKYRKVQEGTGKYKEA